MMFNFRFWIITFNNEHNFKKAANKESFCTIYLIIKV